MCSVLRLYPGGVATAVPRVDLHAIDPSLPYDAAAVSRDRAEAKILSIVRLLRFLYGGWSLAEEIEVSTRIPLV